MPERTIPRVFLQLDEVRKGVKLHNAAIKAEDEDEVIDTLNEVRTRWDILKIFMEDLLAGKE